MKNIFNLSVILLLAVFVTACNQNETGQYTYGSRQ